MIVKKILSSTYFKTCVVRKEIVAIDDKDPGFEMKKAYSLIDGSYIGGCKTAEYFEKAGIVPQAISGNKVSSIGFCEKEQKWYGFSHRAVYGFGIGSKVKKGDCAYEPSNPQDLLNDMIGFWIEPENECVTETKLLSKAIGVLDPDNDRDGLGVLIEYEKTRKKDGELLSSNNWRPYPDVWGRGEWKANTLGDAKQMAIDFARGVS